MFTGGLDSTVLAYASIVQSSIRTRGIYFDLDRPPSPRERASINRTSKALDMAVEFVDLRRITTNVLGHLPFAMTAAADLDFDPNGERIPTAVARGGFASMLTLAAFYSHALDIDKIALALIKGQFIANPQIPTFLTQLSGALATLQPNLPAITFETPFSGMSKAQVITAGQALGVPFEDTWSCHRYGELHCGECVGCTSRKQAFTTAGVPDPTTYVV
ncbi:MAG: 7-cyano-7-deazaguanine synthase [Enhygromyxa sp.]